MSNNGPSSTTPPYNSSQRVEPNFFGRFINLPTANGDKKRKVDRSHLNTADVAAPPPENPYYMTSSPPSYSEATVSTNPSAPPLELPTSDGSALSNPAPYYPPYSPGQQPQQQQPYYGSTMSNNTAIQANSQWPWVQPSSIIGSPPQQPVLSPNRNYPPPLLPLLPNSDGTRRQATPRRGYCCHIFTIALIIGFILYTVGISSFSWHDDIFFYCGRATHSWQDFPTEFSFEPKGGLILHVYGHGSSTGKINIIRDEDKALLTGHVRSTAYMSSTSSPSYGLRYDLSQLKNETTLLSIWIPASVCIELDTVISLPNNQTVELLDIQLHNSIIAVDMDDDDLDEDYSQNTNTTPPMIKDLRLKTSNKAITLDSRRKGNSIRLETTNGHVSLRKPISLTSNLYLTTTNGGISFSNSIHAQSIIARTTNAGIDYSSTISKEKETAVLNATDTIDLSTSNGHIYLPRMKMITNHSYLRSRNGPIRVHHAVIRSDVTAETSNAPIELHVEDSNKLTDSPADAVASPLKIDAQTSNSRISLTAPVSYEGPIQVDTSSTGRVEVIDPLNWLKIDYVHKGHVKGYRQKPIAAEIPNQSHSSSKIETANEGNIHVQTSNAGVHLEFSDNGRIMPSRILPSNEVQNN